MAPGLDDSPNKSEEAHTAGSPVSTGRGSKPNANANAPTKVPYVTSALRRAHTVAQGKHIAKKSNIGSKAVEEKATPPIRIKDSHELLPRRSLKQLGPQKVPRETLPAVRESSHFTVGNVGQNGKIFLRYESGLMVQTAVLGTTFLGQMLTFRSRCQARSESASQGSSSYASRLSR